MSILHWFALGWITGVVLLIWGVDKAVTFYYYDIESGGWDED